MTIRAQLNAWVVVAALVLPIAFGMGLYHAHQVERRMDKIDATERLVASATQLRQIAVDTALFHEARAQDQWQRKFAGIQIDLNQILTSSAEDRANIERMRKRIALAQAIYPRLIGQDTAGTHVPATPAHRVASAVEVRTIASLFVITQEILDTGAELILRNRAEAKRSLRALQMSIGLIVLSMGVLIILIWWSVGRRILRPLREIEHGTQRIAAGDYNYRLKLQQRDEIGELATEFDRMTARVQQTQDALVVEVANSRRAEIALQESAQYTQAILDSAADGIISIDAKGNIQSANLAIEAMFGYTAADLIGHNIQILVPEVHHGEIVGYLETYHRTTQQAGIRRELEGQRKDGQVFAMDLALSRSTHQGQPLFIGLVRDISLQKQHAQELDRLSERLKIATQAARVGIWEYDVVNRTITWDEVMYSLYGITQEAFAGEYEAWRAGVHPDDQARGDAEVTQALAGIAPFDTSFRVVWPSGEIHWIRAVAGVERDADGQALRMVGTNWDITAEKKAEQVKAEFVATVSHELRTPLTSISGSLGLMIGGVLGTVPEAMRKMLDIAHKNSLRLSHLINDLLDIEKLVAGKMQINLSVQPLMPLVEQVIQATRAYGDRYGVAFRVTESADDVSVNVDGSRLQQVLDNLLSNAAKYSPAGDTVRIVVRSIGENVRVSVTDSGPGVPLEFHAHIFEKFSQADSSDSRMKGGSGMGLAISKQLIERMHGQIGFTSTPGRGACFYFELPVAEALVTQVSTPSLGRL